jgi:flavorubredoxin
VHAGTIVLGTSTILAGPHPLAAYAAFLANALRPRAKYFTVIGSYGWAGKAVETLAGMMSKLKAEMLDPVMAKGLPREADYAALDALADTIADKHRDLGTRKFADLTVCHFDT